MNDKELLMYTSRGTFRKGPDGSWTPVTNTEYNLPELTVSSKRSFKLGDFKHNPELIKEMGGETFIKPASKIQHATGLELVSPEFDIIGVASGLGLGSKVANKITQTGKNYIVKRNMDKAINSGIKSRQYLNDAMLTDIKSLGDDLLIHSNISGSTLPVTNTGFIPKPLKDADDFPAIWWNKNNPYNPGLVSSTETIVTKPINLQNAGVPTTLLDNGTVISKGEVPFSTISLGYVPNPYTGWYDKIKYTENVKSHPTPWEEAFDYQW